MVENSLFKDAKIISTYTSIEALEDGCLFDITIIKKEQEKGLFNYITNNLLDNYGILITNEKMNIPGLMDLLNQSNQAIKRISKNYTKFDHFFNFEVENVNGEKIKVYAVQNETGKFTLMIPGDY